MDIDKQNINSIIKEEKISKGEKLNDTKFKEKTVSDNQIINNSTLYESNSASYNKNDSSNVLDSNNSANPNYIIDNKNDDEHTPKMNMNIVSSNISDNNNNISNNNEISYNPNGICNLFQSQQVQNSLISHIENEQKMFSRQNILNAFGDQNTTIFLQKQLRTISEKEIDYIIYQLKGIFRDIIKDKNGNYFCNDLFKECNQKQRMEILGDLYETLSEDCLNNYSSHPIQTLIDRASNEDEYKYILYSFNDYNKLLYASLDPNGAYTIQKIIDRIPEKYRNEFNFIFSSFIGFTSKKKYGIVTVKKFISGTKSDKVIEQIMKFIEENFMNLAVDQYANYLIQFLLDKWNNIPEGNQIKQLIKKNFEIMYQKKYSSFICESYIKIISKEEKQELIKSLNIKKIIDSNNHHAIKILKQLGVNINPNNNNSNNNLHLPMSLNNNKINFPVNIMPNNNNINFNNPNMVSRFNFINNSYPNYNNTFNNYNLNNFNIPFNSMNNNINNNIKNSFENSLNGKK